MLQKSRSPDLESFEREIQHECCPDRVVLLKLTLVLRLGLVALELKRLRVLLPLLVPKPELVLMRDMASMISAHPLPSGGRKVREEVGGSGVSPLNILVGGTGAKRLKFFLGGPWSEATEFFGALGAKRLNFLGPLERSD